MVSCVAGKSPPVNKGPSARKYAHYCPFSDSVLRLLYLRMIYLAVQSIKEGLDKQKVKCHLHKSVHSLNTDRYPRWGNQLGVGGWSIDPVSFALYILYCVHYWHQRRSKGGWLLTMTSTFLLLEILLLSAEVTSLFLSHFCNLQRLFMQQRAARFAL
jgi:hypothetical protein